MKIETLAVHAGRQIDTATAAVSPPIHLSTTYQRDADGGYARSFSYTRPDNPTRHSLEACIAALEGGAEAVCFASGSAATHAVFSLLRPGDHVIAPRECYHGTRQQLREIVSGWGVRVDFVDPTQSLAELDAHLTPATRLIWIETPCNPTVRVTDIAAVAERARTRGALLVVDNTFATPIVQRPLELGADLVMHSSTKYFGGHSDVMGGAVVARERSDACERIRNYQGVAGAVPSPFDCWLIRRSLATLPLRVRTQCANALEVAEYLRTHPRVERVFYPGLAGDPGHAVAARQMRGFGAVVAVCVRGGAAEALAVAARTRVFIRATSLGGVESLIEHRASVEGPDTPTPQNLLRLSIGIENGQDLIADLEQALRAG
ncbi:MAG TPA: aminotransferase class V-fold PLP-dependent enzyme [Steroidobacteraceae bacterium]|nr:aminotransferase class V-fold PLP-dependent enzyme [Steroidobacteraceae bacterium]